MLQDADDGFHGTIMSPALKSFMEYDKELTAVEDSGARCSACGYNLTGLTSQRCPECGQPIEEDLAAAPFCIDFSDRIGPDRLQVASPIDAPPHRPAIERMVSTTWRERSAAAELQGHQLYNGSLVGLLDWSKRESIYRLVTKKTDYRHFLGTNLWNGSHFHRYGPDAYANAIGTSAVVITADQRLLFGRRQGWVAAHAGFLHSIGGMLEPTDLDGGGHIDAFAAMRRELMEELAIAADHIASLTCTGLIRDVEIMQPELVFDAELSLSAAQIESRLIATGAHQEHSHFEHCPDDPDSVAEFVARSQPMAAVAVGAALLHGWHDWGRQWYEANCYLLFGELPQSTRTITP